MTTLLYIYKCGIQATLVVIVPDCMIAFVVSLDLWMDNGRLGAAMLADGIQDKQRIIERMH